MSDFTRNLLAMKMKDDLRSGLNRKLEIMKKNMESILE